MQQRLKSFIRHSKYLYLWLPIFFVQAAFARGVGEFAENILTPVCIMTDVFYKICYIIGFALCIASGIQYKAHRDNPLHVRVSQPIALLIFGLAFILLPLIGQLSTGEPSTGTVR
jgi:hypothetical protein